MSIRIDLPGVDGVIFDDEVFEAVAKAVEEAAFEFTETIANDARNTSAFSDASGKTRRSIKAERVTAGSKFFLAERRFSRVSALIEGAAFLELGTSKMRRRPFTWPGYERNKGAFLNKLHGLIK